MSSRYRLFWCMPILLIFSSCATPPTYAQRIQSFGIPRLESVPLHLAEQVVPFATTGPMLHAKGGGDVAIEEMELSVETIDPE
ncbi:MAG: hypothetical protein WCY74_02250 [Sphaerochaetaceae bacterium]|mgnify:CR=1 FL=1|nr:hypothetical protein [Sphaerochaetaceae bacterium]MDX9938568.1 hypothetical protein [Sphaerochaetaceae bacterium]